MQPLSILMPYPFTGPKMFVLVKFLGWLKKFGLAQNILGLVKGQGIEIFLLYKHFVPDKKMIWIQQNCFLCRHKRF